MSLVRLLKKHRVLLLRVAARAMLLVALAAVAGSGPAADCARATAARSTQDGPVTPPGQPGPGSDWPDPQGGTPGSDWPDPQAGTPGSDWLDPQGGTTPTPTDREAGAMTVMSRPTSGACGA
jgi:hypothetical protein